MTCFTKAFTWSQNQSETDVNLDCSQVNSKAKMTGTLSCHISPQRAYYVRFAPKTHVPFHWRGLCSTMSGRSMIVIVNASHAFVVCLNCSLSPSPVHQHMRSNRRSCSCAVQNSTMGMTQWSNEFSAGTRGAHLYQ